MKNTFKLLVFILLLLSPSLLSAQRLREGDASSTVTDSTLAFRVSVPFKMVIPFSRADQRERDKYYHGTDSTENTQYIFGFSALQPGFFVMDDSSYYAVVKMQLGSTFSKLYWDTAYSIQGHFVEDFFGISKATGVSAVYRHILRGNGWYALIASSTNQAPSAKVGAFFNSFSMLDHPDQSWHQAMAPDSALTTWTPSPLIIRPEDTSGNFPDQVRYLAFDSSHFNSYFINRQQISPYFWSLSESALYAGLLAQRTAPSDSVIYQKPVHNGDAQGWEWMRKPRNGSMYERERILLNGDHFYFLFTYATKDDAVSPNTNRFFEDFRFVHPVEKTHLFESRAAALFSDLYSTDPALAGAAFAALPTAPLGKKDLPALYASMFKRITYKGKLNGYYVSVALENRIIEIHDTSSFRWAAAHYKTVPEQDDYLKGRLLNVMASFPSEAHYSEIAALLKASVPEIFPIDFIVILEKHLRQVTPIMPQLLSLHTDSVTRLIIIGLAGMLADSNLLPAAELAPFEHYLLRTAASRITYLSIDHGVPQRTDDAMISLLGLLNTDASNAALRKYLELETHNERVKAFAALLRNEKQTNEDIRSLAEDKSTRLDLYRILEKAGRLQLFPVAFRTSKLFSESAVYAAVLPFEQEPPSIDFLDTKVTGTGAASKSYFFYTVKSKNGSIHLACAGPYSPDQEQNGNPNATAVYDYRHFYDPAYGQLQTSSLLAKWPSRR